MSSFQRGNLVYINCDFRGGLVCPCSVPYDGTEEEARAILSDSGWMMVEAITARFNEPTVFDYCPTHAKMRW